MAKHVYHRTDALLTLARRAISSETLDHVQTPIQLEIARSYRRFKRAKGSNGQDSTIDDECERIEELLGLAFGATQSYITTFRTRIATLSNACKEDFGQGLSFSTNPKGFDVLQRGDPFRVGVPYSTVQVVNAIANYWKHQEDWPLREEKQGRWLRSVWDAAGVTPIERRTIEIVTAIGMTPLSTGNLRLAAEILGATDYRDLSQIRTKVTDWAEALYQDARLELARLQSGAK